MSRVQIAVAAAAAADHAWHASLIRAFGKDAVRRRYEADQSAHPFECRSLYFDLTVARLEHDAAWMAERSA